MRRPQFTLRALLVAMLLVAAFFGGIRFERERQRRAKRAVTEIVDDGFRVIGNEFVSRKQPNAPP